MSEHNLHGLHGLPKAKIEKTYLTWLLWAVPVAAAGLCAYFILSDLIFSGPTITIYFQKASGLQKNNSTVNYRGIRIGRVENVELQEKKQRVAVTVSLNGSAGDIARQGSVFWVVHPEVTLDAISGLRTIVAGNYITVQPGTGPRTNTFVGAEEAPIEPVKALNIQLRSRDLGSLERRSPILYRGIQVGEVVDYHLAPDTRYVILVARIRDPYNVLVRDNSKFWNAGGIHVHVGLFSGAQISAESAQTVLTGGIGLAMPTDYGSAATNDEMFELNAKADDDWKDWDPDIAMPSIPHPTKSKSAGAALDSP